MGGSPRKTKGCGEERKWPTDLTENMGSGAQPLRRGLPFSANKLREKKLRPSLTSLGIPLAGFHAFRQGVATTLIDRGASSTTVEAPLHHSDPRIKLGLYAHVVP